MKCEICCDSPENALIAKNAGADRVELCTALSCGGVTPSIALIKRTRELVGPEFPIHILIRCREGDFTYSAEELQVMVRDIQAAVAAGADGVVIGALTEDGEIDMLASRIMRAAAKDASITYSRAFDLVKDMPKALTQLIELGCERVLTSGGAATAMEGLETLKQLNAMAKDDIIILAASGINESNFMDIMRATGVKEIHGSMRSNAPANDYKELPGLENSHKVTSARKISFVKTHLKQNP